ncbi:hypothetical protein HYS47_02490 [Candidatus Woesearchaeota archaeon]|nr:hypothetical protein [Candidatus Woesearchaeota archaeon]
MMDDDEFVDDFIGDDAGSEEEDDDENSSIAEKGFLQGYKESDDIEKTVDFNEDE